MSTTRTGRPRLVPTPVWPDGPHHPPYEHNGELLVWELLDQVKGAEITVQYEPVLYPGTDAPGMRPDILLEAAFYWTKLHIEITDSNSYWGPKKRARMMRIEERYRIPVLFVNRWMLRRLEQDDGLDVLYSWIYHVMFKPPQAYGEIISPQELFIQIGEEYPTSVKRKRAKRQRRLRREYLAQQHVANAA